MKRKISVWAIIFMLAFSLTVCDDGNGQDTNKEIDTNFIGGKAGKIKFSAGKVAANARSAVDRTSSLDLLEGKIEDGSSVFVVTGFSDPDTGNFFLSGGSASVVYEIRGCIDNSGKMDFGEIDRKSLVSNEWQSDLAPFVRDDDVSINGAGQTIAGGAPEELMKKWTAEVPPESGIGTAVTTTFVVTPLGVSQSFDWGSSAFAAEIEEQVDGLTEAIIQKGEDTVKAMAKAYGYVNAAQGDVNAYEAAVKNVMRAKLRREHFGDEFNFLEGKETADGYEVIGYNRIYDKENVGVGNKDWKSIQDRSSGGSFTSVSGRSIVIASNGDISINGVAIPGASSYSTLIRSILEADPVLLRDNAEEIGVVYTKMLFAQEGGKTKVYRKKAYDIDSALDSAPEIKNKKNLSATRNISAADMKQGESIEFSRIK
ncbi:MAG: hypothetical protein LBH44_13600 [Treponema sp.]|jgi:hypothetical protein|nr:hypothetical protein [Treponema sp.]